MIRATWSSASLVIAGPCKTCRLDLTCLSAARCFSFLFIRPGIEEKGLGKSMVTATPNYCRSLFLKLMALSRGVHMVGSSIWWTGFRMHRSGPEVNGLPGGVHVRHERIAVAQGSAPPLPGEVADRGGDRHIGASRSLALFPGLAGRDPSQAAHAESVAILRKIRAGAGKRSLARRL